MFEKDEDPFSFYQKIYNGEYNRIDVEKQHIGGLFYAGVIQYAFSFYNENAQETPVIYTTPLNYISKGDGGVEPNKQVGCSFNIKLTINKIDCKNFDHVRIYSIYRTSLNGTPQVKVVNDFRCDSMTAYMLSGSDYVQWNGDSVDDIVYYQVCFIDTNESGYDFDAYRIIIGNDHIKPAAIA